MDLTTNKRGTFKDTKIKIMLAYIKSGFSLKYATKKAKLDYEEINTALNKADKEIKTYLSYLENVKLYRNELREYKPSQEKLLADAIAKAKQYYLQSVRDLIFFKTSGEIQALLLYYYNNNLACMGGGKIPEKILEMTQPYKRKSERAIYKMWFRESKKNENEDPIGEA